MSKKKGCIPQDKFLQIQTRWVSAEEEQLIRSITHIPAKHRFAISEAGISSIQTAISFILFDRYQEQKGHTAYTVNQEKEILQGIIDAGNKYLSWLNVLSPKLKTELIDKKNLSWESIATAKKLLSEITVAAGSTLDRLPRRKVRNFTRLQNFINSLVVIFSREGIIVTRRGPFFHFLKELLAIIDEPYHSDDSLSDSIRRAKSWANNNKLIP